MRKRMPVEPQEEILRQIDTESALMEGKRLMSIGDILLKIKKRESPFYATLFNIAEGVLRIHVPVVGPGKLFYKALYGVHVALRESIIWMLRFLYYEPLFRARCERVGKGLQMERLPYIEGHGKIVIGDNIYLSGKSTFLVGNKLCESSVLEIGNNSSIGHGCHITAGSRVSIGNNVMIAGGVRISDNDGHPLDTIERRQGLPVREEDIKPVEIKDDVWIGANSWIGKGVVIGERSIVGAHSVVRRSVPPDSIVVGNPGRDIRNFGKFPLEIPTCVDK